MKLSEKITVLREKADMTQTELAETLGVPRQTVTRWENGKEMPDIGTIVRLSELFGVSTDTLIKDDVDISEGERPRVSKERRNVTYAEAEEYLKAKIKSARLIAIATFLIMLAPGLMMIIMTMPGVNKTVNVAVGLSLLIVFAAISVGIYVRSYYLTSKFEYISNEDFSLDYNALSMLDSLEKTKSQNYTVRGVAATVICIISAIPLIATAIIAGEEKPFYVVIALAITLLIAGVGVAMFIMSGVERSAISALRENKKTRAVYSKRLEDSVESTFWTITVAVYLFYSFNSGKWHSSWIIFIFAAAISGIISTAFSFIRKASGSEPEDDEDND